MSHDHFEDVGAYLLGALDPAEHEAFEHALETDELLRAEVDRLRIAVDALPASAVQFEPPPGLKGRIMAVVEAEAELLQSAAATPRKVGRPARRAGWLRRPGFALAALACALTVGVFAGQAVLDEDRSVVTASLGDAQLIQKGDGEHATLVVENLDPPGAGRVYQVWLQHEGEAPEATNALFSTRSDGTASVDVPGSLEDVSAVLVTEEPAGGSQAPTTKPVIAANPA